MSQPSILAALTSSVLPRLAGPSLAKCYDRHHRKSEVQFCNMPVHVGGHHFGGVTQRRVLRCTKPHRGRENVGELQQQGDLTSAAALQVQLLLIAGQQALAGLVVESCTVRVRCGKSKAA